MIVIEPDGSPEVCAFKLWNRAVHLKLHRIALCITANLAVDDRFGPIVRIIALQYWQPVLPNERTPLSGFLPPRNLYSSDLPHELRNAIRAPVSCPGLCQVGHICKKA
jgi:hypothetical protein